jgi:multiple sugar transport system substrate-binding protein
MKSVSPVFRHRLRKGVTVTLASAAAIVTVLGTAGCGEAEREAAKANSNEITLWTHTAGFDDQLNAVKQIVKDYNASSGKKATVKIQAFPQTSYNDSVISASSANKLPCLVDVDQPNVPYWASAGVIQPLDNQALLKRSESLLQSAVGKWNGATYGVGYTDDTVALFARKSVLKVLGIRQATFDQPWSKAELMDALSKMKNSGKNPVTGTAWDYPFDMGTASSGGEWYSYAFSPLLQSFGGDLINRDGYKTSDGVLNNAKAVEFGKWMHSLVTDKYMAVKGASDTGLEFVNDKIGLLYSGEWTYGTMKDNNVDINDIAIMPPPDLGEGSVTAGGAWEVAVTKSCNNTEAAQDYINFSLQDKYILSMAGSSLPASEAAMAQSDLYKEGGDLAVMAEISKKYVKMRPETPSYSFISTEFDKTVSDIINGADVKETLDSAVTAIDANIKSTEQSSSSK